MKCFCKLSLLLGLLLPLLLATGCESRMTLDARMDEIAGEYVLVQPDPEHHPIAQADYEAIKVASIRKSGSAWVLDYICPVISYKEGRYAYSFRRFCQDIYYNQVRGTYVVAELSAADLQGSGLTTGDLEPVKITSRELCIGSFTWNKQ